MSGWKRDATCSGVPAHGNADAAMHCTADQQGATGVEMDGTIFGGAGFIGSNIVNGIAADWTVADDFSLGKTGNLHREGVKILKGDISDAGFVESALSQRPDFVMMMNGLSSNPMHHPDPRRGCETIVLGALNVFDCCRRFDIPKVIYASTSSMYGKVPAGKQSEEARTMPPNFYSCAKIAMENYALVYGEDYGIDSFGLRYFSVYGPNERHKGVYANIITQFLWDMLEGKRPGIYGDGGQTRDFTYVGDVVEANRLAIESSLKGAQVFNIGTGKMNSFNRVVELINLTLGTDIKPKYIPNQIHNYIFKTLASVKKAKTGLGFEADVSLEEGIRKIVEFYRI